MVAKRGVEGVLFEVEMRSLPSPKNWNFSSGILELMVSLLTLSTQMLLGLDKLSGQTFDLLISLTASFQHIILDLSKWVASVCTPCEIFVDSLPLPASQIFRPCLTALYCFSTPA